MDNMAGLASQEPCRRALDTIRRCPCDLSSARGPTADAVVRNCATGWRQLARLDLRHQRKRASPKMTLEAIPLGVQATGACERFSVCCDRHPSPSVLKATAKTPRAPRTPGFLGWIVRSIAPGEFHSTTSRDKRARSAKSAGGAPCDDGESKMEHRDVRVSALLPAH